MWFEGLNKSGFRLIGLFDRYEECDDIPNPFWGINKDLITERIAIGQFANNIEILIQKPGGQKFSFPKQKSIMFTSFSTPPRAWFNTFETESMSKRALHTIWRKHHMYLTGKNGELTSSFLKTLPIPTLQRLARLGAILPQQLGYEAAQVAREPIGPKAVAKTIDNAGLNSQEVENFIATVCAEHAVTPRYKTTVSARMRRALIVD
jgi:hypothetical protein